MNLNVFQWIREGVRQSVLLGVSDAMEHLGTSSDGDDMRTRLQDMARRSDLAPAVEGPKAEARPKRLGRSLREMEQ